MSKEWRHIEWECCPECGGDVDVLTDADDGLVGDSEQVECNECGARGSTTVCDDEAWVNWDTEDDLTGGIK